MKIRTKLAKRLLIIAVVFFLLVGGAGGLYTYRKVTRRAEAERAHVEGLKALAAGDNQRAVELLGNYIGYFGGTTRRPDDDAMIAFAKVRPLIPLPQGEHLRQTIYVLRQLLENKPDTELVEQRRELLDLYVKTQFWTEAGLLADRLVPPGKKAPAVADAPAYAARTKADNAQGKYDEALRQAWTWVSLDPRNLEGQVLLIELARRTSKYKDPSDKHDKSAGTTDLAERLIAASYAKLPATGPATRSAQDAARDAFLRGYAHFLYADTDADERRAHRAESAGQLHAAVDYDFHDRRLTEMFISLLDQLHLVDDAIVVLRRLDNQPGDSVTKDAVHARLARRLWEVEDFKSVIDLLADLKLDEPGTDAQLMGLDALAELGLGNKDRARAILAKLAARGEKADSTSGAKTDTAAGAWAQAVKSSLEPQSVEPLKVAAVCEKALVGNKDPYLAFILGGIQIDHQDRDAALANWKNSAQWGATWAKPLLYMAPVLSRMGRHQEAVAAAFEGVLRAPHSVPAALTYLALLDAAVDAGVVSEPAKVLANTERDFPALMNSDTMLCLRVNLLAASGRTQDAAAAIDARLKSDKPPARQGLARLLVISRKRDLGQQVKEIEAETVKDFGQTPRDAMTRVTSLIDAGKSAEAVSTFEKLREAARESQSLEWRVAWAQCLDRASDPRAKAAVVQLADAETGNINVQIFAGDARSTSSDREFLKRVEGRVHELAGESTPWRMIAARNALRFASGPQDAEFNNAVELLRRVVADSPSSVEARVLLADALERSGGKSEAVDQMKAAVSAQPQSPQLILQYASLLYRTGDTDAARDQLVRLSKLPGLTPQARFAAAALALETPDHALALSLLGDVTAVTPAQTLLVARVNWVNGRVSEAQAAFQKLVQPADAEPEILEVAAEFYASGSQLDKATVLLDRIAADNRNRGRAQYQLGRYWQKFSGPARALEHYRLAVAADPSLAAAWSDMIVMQLAMGRPKEAVESIGKGAAAAKGDAHLADLNRHADYFGLWDSAPETHRLLQDYVLTREVDPDWMKKIVGQYKAGTTREKMVTFVDQLISSGGRKVLPLYMFAMELRISLGRYPEVDDWAVRTMSAFRNVSEPQAILVRVLEERKKWTRVLAEAQRWRQISGDLTLQPDLAIARAYRHLARPREEVSQLAPYVTDPKNAHDRYLAVLPTYASAVRRNGTADVSSLMEPLLKEDSRGRIAYMRFAVTELNDDTALATAWLDRAAAAIPPGAADEQLMLAGAWRDLYSASPGKPADFLTKASAIVEPLTHSKDLAPAALLQLAGIQELRDPASAEASYRRVLAVASEGTVAQLYALNNLAMLLVKTGGNLNDAADLARSAVKLQPKFGPTNDTLAAVEFARGNFEQALPYARTALEADPRNVQFIIRLARICLASGKPADARTTLSRIGEFEIDTSDLTDDLKKQLSDVRAAVGNAEKLPETRRQ